MALLKNHYENHHKPKSDESLNQDTLQFAQFSKDKFSDILVDWVCKNMHPFTIVEEDYFVTTLKYLNTISKSRISKC